MKTLFLAGTAGPEAGLVYTAAQHDVIHADVVEAALLEALDDPEIEPAKHSELEASLTAVQDRIITVRAANGDRFVKAAYANHLLTPTGELVPLTPELEEHMTVELTKTNPRKSTEVEEHVAEQRFLFVVNEHGCPLVYFQCATENNPEYTPAPA